jgi:hypothetical protein
MQEQDAPTACNFERACISRAASFALGDFRTVKAVAFT